MTLCGSAMAAMPTIATMSARTTTHAVRCGRRSTASRTRPAWAARAIGADESQASITASPNAASPATPHRIGRIITSHAARAAAPPSVSSSNLRTRKPPTTSTRATPPADHINARPTRAAVRQRSADSTIATTKQTSASSGSSHASTSSSRAIAMTVEANAWSPISASVTDTFVAFGARSGATAPSTPVTTAPASAMRSAIESASLSVSARWAACAAARVGPDKRSPPATCVETWSTSGRMATRLGLARTSCSEIERPTAVATASSRRISST